MVNFLFLFYFVKLTEKKCLINDILQFLHYSEKKVIKTIQMWC